MPPVDITPESKIRYFTRLLAALTLQAGGELRIPMKLIRQVTEENARQALFEDTNSDSEELVLRFGTKHSAVYPVESDTCASPQPRSATISPPQPSKPEASTQVRGPLTEEKIMKLQRNLSARLQQIRLRNERTQRENVQEDLLSILEPSLRDSER